MTGQESIERRPKRGVPARPGPFVTEESDDGVNVRVLRGSPTPAEIAAVTAVLTAAVVEESAGADAVLSHGPSAWQRSTRILRTPLMAGPGQWRNFSA
ncbi:acyl-CoA carboxylase epsilon subunit [Mycetocola miduiensis]|uniref:Acyl-CoA carboxylase epsilon subunit n=1 Tax=Mycetocola miduiensis TaxID=995034 RepID=A0A1I5DZ77_9MICO|nr:acyl-CoA carboxylase epsilon subunit [Mycetocola miduiensis]SFO04457.1 Acyl-CoA carboxylase epsilon subunit [Mycetocola miduiensis]